MKFLYLRLALMLSIVLCGQAQAFDAAGGRTVHVQIHNQTSTDCLLLSQKTVHGEIDAPLPQVLPANQSVNFALESTQFWFGPGEMLSYQCPAGTDKTVKFEVSQWQAWWIGHNPSLSVIESNGLKAVVTDEHSSSLVNHRKYGILNIELRPA